MRGHVSVIGALAWAFCVSVHAATGSDDIPRGPLKPDALASPAASRMDARLDVATSTLRVEHVRLEPARAMNVLPSSVLKFDLFNVSANRLTDMVLEITIVERPERDRAVGGRRVLVGPFIIRGSEVLESGYTINYEMLLRNFSPDCSCVANVDVLSVRALPDSGS
jgi:hypothetical protein